MSLAIPFWLVLAVGEAAVAGAVAPASERFADPGATEIPDFQKHVLPMMSRAGCNGRACHGSFQGRGGFRLSLFGYDFEQDLEAMTAGENPRVDTAEPEQSLVLLKPTEQVDHEGGGVIEKGSWQYRLMLRWIEGGAQGVGEARRLERLVVEPAEILFEQAGETAPLKVTAVWSDGDQEDVTCLCRFQSNDPSVAVVDENGVVRSEGKGDTHVVAFYDNGVADASVALPISRPSPETYAAIPSPTKIDALILARLQKLGIVPSPVCTDEEFLRRASLDITGTLPSPKEIRDFLADKSPDKRSRKIDELLERPAYAAWWATRLCDYTGNAGQEFPAPFQATFAKQWYEWIRKRVADNAPYDEMMAAIALGRGREAEESYAAYSEAMSEAMRDELGRPFADRPTMQYFWARRNIRKDEEKALLFSHAFLGVRLECAQCHKHPFDQWTQQEFQQFTQFFKGVAYATAPESRRDFAQMQKESGLAGLKGAEERNRILDLVKSGETVPFREVFSGARPGVGQGRNARKQTEVKGRAITPKLLGGEEAVLSQYGDPREAVVEWMRRPDNPYFARAFVNRVWAAYFGVGIVDPPDDQNLANPPSNGPLLDELVRGFIESGFDMKQLHRTIANSDAYQRSWTPNETNRTDSRNFSRALLRRLPAEVVVDAIDFATASSDRLASLNENLTQRGIYRGGYGPGPGPAGFALKLFGQSDRRTACDCNRTMAPSVVQAVYLQNDTDVQAALNRRDGWLRELAAENKWSLGAPPAEPRGRARDNGKVKEKPAQASAESEVDRRIRRLRQTLASLPADAPEAERRELQRRLARMERMREEEGDAAAEGAKAEAPSIVELARIVDEIYLRTVSRFPTKQERRTAVQHIRGSASPVDGVRDVAWAMLNTKEFIVNH
jgi:hypothetical protein